MNSLPLAVPRWTAGSALPQVAPRLLLTALEAPAGASRQSARQQVRSTLRQLLGQQLGCPPAAVPLHSVAGQPIRLALPATPIGLSVSHEAGLSLAAIHLAGPVGIDLLRLPDDPDWLVELPRLARDYLGPERAAQLATLPLGQQAAGFAAAWTELEAGLKCLELALTEWEPGLAERLRACRFIRLALPPGYVGTLALREADATTRR